MLTSRKQKRSNTQDQTTNLKAQPAVSHVLERWPRLLTVPQLPGQCCELESRCPNTVQISHSDCRGVAFEPPCDILLHASPGWCVAAGSREPPWIPGCVFPFLPFQNSPGVVPINLRSLCLPAPCSSSTRLDTTMLRLPTHPRRCLEPLRLDH